MFAFIKYNDISNFSEMNKSFLYFLVYAMKKSLLSLAGVLAFSAVIGGVVGAQSDISDLFNEWTPLVDGAHVKLLTDFDKERWYVDPSISIECEAENWVTITSPTLQDAKFYDVNLYNLFISPYRIDQIKSWDPEVDTSKIIMKKVEVEDSDESVKFSISSDELDSNKVYYWFITPADVFDTIGTPSHEICFSLANNICLQDSECDSLSVVNNSAEEDLVERHGVADCVWMELANVTHTVKGDTVTLKWTPVDWESVQIAIREKDSQAYKNLWTVDMSKGQFDYKMQWDWEQNFLLMNGCGEWFKYKADAKKWWETPEEIVPAATGPTENILYIAIAAIILYGAYVVFFRKSENN